MQGSFGDAKEAFRGRKQKDTHAAKENRESRQFRDKRRNRHPDAE